MRYIFSIMLLTALFVVTIPAHAVNCGGLQASGTIPAGTYTMTDDCVTTGTLQVNSGTTVTINGNGYALDGGNTHLVLRLIGGATLNLNNVTVRNGNGNSGIFAGGGIWNTGTVTISNSTISGNTGLVAGGIFNDGIGTLTISNSTISGNTGTFSGGGIRNGGTVTVTNTILSANTGGNCFGTLTDGGGNLEDTNTCGLTAGFNTDPMLDTFTGSYYPLLDGSPAIDGAPNCAGLVNDQIGTTRPQGSACDIGAIEMPQTPTGQVIQPVVSAPPMCNVLTDISAFGLPDGVYCRVLMRDGAWMTNYGTVPANLAQANPIIAVDVFRITGQSVSDDDFGGYQQICLQGEGRMIFLDATQSPRPQVEITPTEIINGATCGWIPNAGTLVLLPE